MTRVLITGGAGFIGSHLVDACLAKGFEVRVFDNFATGKRENLAHVAGDVELVEADLRDLDAVRKAMRGVELVSHQGALGSVPRSVADPLTTNAVNVDGTLHVLVAARDAGVRRLVFASSSSVYGDTVELPKREEMPPRPKSPYACSKLAAEEYCKTFHKVYGLGTIALRYFNVFGPRQDPTSQYAAVIPKFVTALCTGARPVVYGDGTQSRDFTFIRNVAEANLLALNAPEEALGQAYNIALNDQVTLLQILDNLGRIIGVTPNPEFAEARAGDVHDSRAAIDLARERLGYQPRVGCQEGLEQTVAWYREGGTGRLDWGT
ncbi:MAG TPA: SDR family oxidoreductase [Armatimonadota bacterium]|mgnify:CR=1 FL=1|nr:SDR family oxidoreductase [Armatimonadota bacterium]HQK92779.1 SDR family oxidoreductase [Armatimonadota bacterium]